MEIQGKSLTYYLKIIFLPLIIYSILQVLLSLARPVLELFLLPFAIIAAAAYIGIVTVKSKEGSIKNALVAGALFGLAAGIQMGLMFYGVSIMYNYFMSPINDQMMYPGLRYADAQAGPNPMAYGISFTNDISNGLMILAVLTPFICLILSLAASAVAAVLTDKSIRKKAII
jgi:hypothetical protein